MTGTMNREIGQQWVAALRSGEYMQGKRRLTQKMASGDRYCCLGVLCDLAVKADDVKVETVVKYNGDVGYDNSTAYLPPSVTVWAGLTAGNVMVDFNGNSTTLADLNDDKEMSFDQIADVIEAHFGLTPPEPEPEPEPVTGLDVELDEDTEMPLVVGEDVTVYTVIGMTKGQVTAVTSKMVRLTGEYGIDDVRRAAIVSVNREARS